MISPIEIISISAVNMMKGIAAARSRRAESNLKRATGGTGSVTGVGATSERQKRDFKRSVAGNCGMSPTVPEYIPDRGRTTALLRPPVEIYAEPRRPATVGLVFTN